VNDGRGAAAILTIPVAVMAFAMLPVHLLRLPLIVAMARLRARRRHEAERGEQQDEDQQQAHRYPIWPSSIHSAIATIITFSVSERKPSGTRLEPPTQAHFSSRFWM